MIIEYPDLNDLTTEGSENGMILSLHNLHVYKEWLEVLNRLSKDDEIFDQFIKTRCSKRVSDSIQFFKEGMDIGVEKAYKKWFLKTYGLEYFAGGHHDATKL